MSYPLCKKCDVYVGFGAIGVAAMPFEHADDPEWLSSHCWICERSAEEVEKNPRGVEVRT